MQGIKATECPETAWEGISDTARFKMAGSSIVVAVAEALFRTLLDQVDFSAVRSPSSPPPSHAGSAGPMIGGPGGLAAVAQPVGNGQQHRLPTARKASGASRSQTQPKNRTTTTRAPGAPAVSAAPLVLAPPSSRLRPRGESCNLCDKLEPRLHLRTCRLCSSRFHFRCPNSALGARQRIVHDVCGFCDDHTDIWRAKCLLRSRQGNGTFDYYVHYIDYDPADKGSMCWVSEDGAIDLTGPEGLKRLPLLLKDKCSACKAPIQPIEECHKKILDCPCHRKYHVSCEFGDKAAEDDEDVKRHRWRCRECRKVLGRYKRPRID